MTKKTPLTQADLEAGYDNPAWGAHGYLGERRHVLQSTDPEVPARPDVVAAADAYVISRANRLGWSADDLFEWANSRLGRWYGDAWFGNDKAYRQKHAPSLVRLPDVEPRSVAHNANARTGVYLGDLRDV